MVGMVTIRDLAELLASMWPRSTHPERQDVGSWRWSCRQNRIATWRHKYDFDRRVTVEPVHYTQVNIFEYDGDGRECIGPEQPFDDEDDAIDAAIEILNRKI
jgi:hypothetical protein